LLKTTSRSARYLLARAHHQKKKIIIDILRETSAGGSALASTGSASRIISIILQT